MLSVLIDEHPAGWASIIGADWRLAPGYDQPSTAPACFCHGSRYEPDNLRTSDARDYQDYLYVLSPIGRTMTAFRTIEKTETLLAIVRLDDLPPDWREL